MKAVSDKKSKEDMYKNMEVEVQEAAERPKRKCEDKYIKKLKHLFCWRKFTEKSLK